MIRIQPKSMRMKIFSVFSLFQSLCVVKAKLVVDSLDDLLISNGDELVYDIQRIIREGDMMNKSLQESECPGVMEEVETWEVFTREDGEEVSNGLEVFKTIDLVSDTMQVTNINEPWVKGSVIIRFVAI